MAKYRLDSYSIEIRKRENKKQRLDNEKSNKVMRKWTILIGIMTAVMLVATIVNVLIAKK